MSITNKIILSLFLTILFFGAGALKSGNAHSAWYNSNWSHRQVITIDESMIPDNVPLPDFPVLIRFTSADSNPVFGIARTDGYDILFTQADGITILDHEIEEYNSATEDMNMWVRIPALSDTSDTVIYMYYGNPGITTDPSTSSTWNSGFAGVWHLKENPDTTCSGTKEVCDSTSPSYHGDDEGSMDSNDQVTGQIDGSLDFDGVDDRINFGDVLDFDVDDEFSICLWFNEISTSRALLTKGQGGNPGYNGYVLDTGGSSGKVRFILREDGDYRYYITQQSTPSPSTGVWRHVCATYDGSNNINGLDLYVQGVNDFVVSGQNGPAGTFLSGYSLYIGTREGGGSYFNGIIDEVRISNTARTPDWIETSFNNQDSPSSFLSFEPQEEFVPVPVMNQWGMIAFVVIAWIGAIYYLRRQKTV